jgi:hypothetical protein
VRTIPLWIRWLLALSAFGAIAFVGVRSIESPDQGSLGDAASLLQANREARRTVMADQAPRSAALAARERPLNALQRAIRSDAAPACDGACSAGRWERFAARRRVRGRDLGLRFGARRARGASATRSEAWSTAPPVG